MKTWFDTEFIDDGTHLDLISIGLIREDGQAYYAEAAECDLSKACDWVQANVVTKLERGDRVLPRAQIAEEIVRFVGNEPTFYGWYADWDWMLLCRLYGRMIDVPKGWPHLCLDVRQTQLEMRVAKVPKQTSPEHHALNDAVWTADTYYWLMNQRRRYDVV